MKKGQILALIAVCVAVFFLVYSPHLNYHYPLHIDEWHHITEAEKLKNGEYSGGGIGYRIGFHVFLLGLSYLSNLVLVYQFLPAIWAVLTSLVLFYVVYKKTGGNYWLALLSMLFFASLKSNVNIEGLWFFTSITFSIPFIFLYVFFFTEGVEKRNKKFILLSLAIMIILIPTHSISVLFAVPFLLVYSLFHFRYIIRNYCLFLFYLVIPILGTVIFSHLNNITLADSILKIITELQFMKGWGVLEINNSFLEVYSLVGYMLAVLGIFFIFKNKEIRKYLAYVLWTVSTLAFIFIFRLTDVSYFAPYQRMFYYFAISLPFLSAIGLFYSIQYLKEATGKFSKIVDKTFWKKVLSLFVASFVFLFMFYSYLDIPNNIKVYHLIDDSDYSSLIFLKNQSSGKVISSTFIGSAAYAVSEKNPVGALYFYGNKTVVEKFFSAKNCTAQNKILTGQNASYVLVETPINCNWTLIYNQTDLIYTFRNKTKRVW